VELSKYIKEVLFSKDNVIIPEFGAFEKITVSASIDEKTGEMAPPHTNVVFKPELKSDNGILIKYIAEKEKIEENKATEEIKKQVDVWNANISSGKNVILPGIGLIHKDSNGEITFKSDVKPSEFPDSYGLPVITVQEKTAAVRNEPIEKKNTKKPIKKTPVKKTPAKKQPVKKTKTTGENKSNKKLIVGLAIGVPIVALIVLGALNFDFVKQKVGEGSNYVSNLFSSKKETDSSDIKDDLVVNIDSLSAKDSTNAETEEILENYTIVNSETNAKIEPKIEELNTAKKIHIIGGSFRQKKLAQRQRNKLNRKGYKATILPINKGLYRVSVASYDDIESAVKDFGRIKSIDESLSFWILLD
jgi:nucleoid DNA-binding protein